MKKIAIVCNEFYKNNTLFDLHDTIKNRDNCLYPFYQLKKNLENNGFSVATSDINSISNSELIIYNEMPYMMPLKRDIEKSSLILFESELIRPDNWDLKKHAFFKYIFTWNDSLVDNKKYFKINFSHDFSNLFPPIIKDKKLITLIAGNKKINHRQELYSKRKKLIEWYEKYHLESFDLYGIGWDKIRFPSNSIFNILNKLNIPSQFICMKHSSYKGTISNKSRILSHYDFCICFENAIDIEGYITEKIFDCFFSLCIPIYLGASNIDRYIPKNCFIDMRDFKTFEDLYIYITTMDDKIKQGYISNIKDFLNSPSAYQFSAENFASTISNVLLGKNFES